MVLMTAPSADRIVENLLNRNLGASPGRANCAPRSRAPPRDRDERHAAAHRGRVDCGDGCGSRACSRQRMQKRAADAGDQPDAA
jgi:hypothetical protein